MGLSRAQLNSAVYAPGNSRWRAALTEEEKAALAKRISEANKGKKLSSATRQRISEAQLGKIRARTPEWQEKITRALKGRPGTKHSAATKDKISRANKGRLKGIKRGPQSLATKEKQHRARVEGNRTVLTVTPLGNFESRAEAARAHGIDAGTISNWVKKGVPGFGYSQEKDQKKLLFDQEVFQKRQSARVSRALHKAVVTPFGEFQSIRSAAIAMGIDRSTLADRIKRRWAGYGFKGDVIHDGLTKKSNRRRVLTPVGVIDGVGNAARQLGISSPTLRDRIRAGESGYAFLPNELLPLSQHKEHEARGEFADALI
jgi:hypothetical protein